MNTQRSAYTGWMTTRDRQLFRMLLEGLPAQTRAEVVDALARNEKLRDPGLAEARSGEEGRRRRPNRRSREAAA